MSKSVVITWWSGATCKADRSHERATCMASWSVMVGELLCNGSMFLNTY